MTPHRFLRSLPVAAILWAALAGPVLAVEVQFVAVLPGVFAHIGDTGPRSVANEGLNANIGLIETPQGAILIDSGATQRSAAQILAAARRVTQQPVKWVINTGGQDHRWLGNAYFAAQGAQVIAHEAARADMQARGGDHVATLTNALGELATGTAPMLPTRWIAGPDTPLVLGGLRLELRHRGGGHTPGDMLVALPDQRLVFSGDLVYADRLLGVIPVSNTRAWLDAFAALEALAPAVIVPGHGRVTTLPVAQAQTRDYLRALRAHMKKAVDDGVDISQAIKTFDASRWAPLLNAAELLPGNASRTYLELERE